MVRFSTNNSRCLDLMSAQGLGRNPAWRGPGAPGSGHRNLLLLLVLGAESGSLAASNHSIALCPFTFERSELSLSGRHVNQATRRRWTGPVSWTPPVLSN